ncbi:hypothetical protein UFOVP1672_68 [uncultured Caudovirales phage]|uniref:Uncharacterized protein n=1 Tax=uncultured Caudovirales phage TaxID=2100421 RepID=A0A6J5PZU9_9CAUD|nr:hypothetical protein UFOVP988_6 [uncultured Caudovirales phage]CAB4210377.1 hypothetical protein UFOVP1425_6 [uncultured Caudovirales phage]CAB4223475.1 hypothetical protein UFOVP1672_68 [uncultured Caudovirales phage]
MLTMKSSPANDKSDSAYLWQHYLIACAKYEKDQSFENFMNKFDAHRAWSKVFVGASNGQN